jgi:hypothetical protein
LAASFEEAEVRAIASRARRIAALLVAAFGVALAWPGLAQAPASASAPQEVDGQVNGKRVRLVASGDNVLLSAAEADRIGLGYRDSKALSIGGTPLWIVTLGSVTVEGRTYINAPAGVVPSIADYFAALRAHPAEALARSRETKAEINGIPIRVYDLGDAGVLVSPAEAERAGLHAADGRPSDLGRVHAWVIDAVVKTAGADKPAPATVTVAEPESYFEELMAAAAKAKQGEPRR